MCVIRLRMDEIIKGQTFRVKAVQRGRYPTSASVPSHHPCQWNWDAMFIFKGPTLTRKSVRIKKKGLLLCISKKNMNTRTVSGPNQQNAYYIIFSEMLLRMASVSDLLLSPILVKKKVFFEMTIGVIIQQCQIRCCSHSNVVEFGPISGVLKWDFTVNGLVADHAICKSMRSNRLAGLQWRRRDQQSATRWNKKLLWQKKICFLWLQDNIRTVEHTLTLIILRINFCTKKSDEKEPQCESSFSFWALHTE